MAAGQRDIPVLLQPGSGATVRAPGEFMYLAFADREILAIVTGLDGTQSRLKMVTGDFTKPAGGIEEVELVNPDPDTPCAVTVIIGAGEFDRKIIQGEVTVNPGIRRADGQFVEDTRRDLSLRVALSNLDTQEYVYGSVVFEVDDLDTYNDNPGGIIHYKEGPKFLCGDNSSSEIYLLTVDGTKEAISWPGDNQRCCQVPRGIMTWTASPVTGNLALTIVDLYDFTIRSRVDTGVNRINDNAGNHLCYDPDTGMVFGALYDGDSGRLFKATAEGDLITLGEPLPAGAAYNGDPINVVDGVIHVGNSTSGTALSSRICADLNLNLLTLDSWKLPTTADGAPSVEWFSGRGRNSRHYWGLITTDSRRLFEVAVTEWTRTAIGSVSSCGGARLFNLENSPTDATISTRVDDNGKVLVTGQVLKAVLDLYFRDRFARADYLDHIYGVRFEQANGVLPFEVRTGGSSFRRAGIDDWFTDVPMPQTITITADAELQPE